MTKDKRKATRRQIRYNAWIALGPDNKVGCSLADISDTGARLEIDDPPNLPERFTLFLAGNGAAKRLCRVVWRQDSMVGVTFEERTPLSDRVAPPTLAQVSTKPPGAPSTTNE